MVVAKLLLHGLEDREAEPLYLGNRSRGGVAFQVAHALDIHPTFVTQHRTKTSVSRRLSVITLGFVERSVTKSRAERWSGFIGTLARSGNKSRAHSSTSINKGLGCA